MLAHFKLVLISAPKHTPTHPHTLTLALCCRRRLQSNSALACPALDGSTLSLWLSRRDYTCNTSPHINLDTSVLGQSLLDGGRTITQLDTGVATASWPNSGLSFSQWASAGKVQTTVDVGLYKTTDTLPALSTMHASIAGTTGIQWLPSGSTGATFCVVARLPTTTSAGNQVLFDFSPAFRLARDTGSSLAFFVGATKGTVASAFDGRWHSYVVLVTSTKTNIYRDNVLLKQFSHASVTAASSTATTHLFGAPKAASTAVLSADVRQVMAWRRALSATELTGLQAQMKVKWKLA